MTEDDTFRVLARPSVPQMMELHAEWTLNNGEYPTTENLKFAKYYGWSWLEYMHALKRYEGR